MTIFLQATTLAAEAAANVATSMDDPKKTLSYFELIQKGGLIMVPIFVLSLIAVYIFVERYLSVKSNTLSDSGLLTVVKEKVQAGKTNEAIRLCENSSLPIARMLEKAIIRLGSSIRDIESAMENVAAVEVSKMEKNMGILIGIAAVAPMLGFLGTVFGMIQTFQDISTNGNISIDVIAGGIQKKMVTSAAGLVVGIMAHIFHTLLNTMIEKKITGMELQAIDFLDILYKPAYEDQKA